MNLRLLLPLVFGLALGVAGGISAARISSLDLARHASVPEAVMRVSSHTFGGEEIAKKSSAATEPLAGRRNVRELIAERIARGRATGVMRPDAAWSDALRELVSGDFPGLLEHSEAIPLRSVRIAFRRELLAQWSRIDPMAALQWLAGCADARGPWDGSNAIATGWAERNPLAAAQWAATLPAGEQREGPMREALEALAGSDPQAAFEFAREMADSDEAGHWIGIVFPVWAALDPDAALAAAASLRGPELRESAEEQIAIGWVRRDPASALAWTERLPAERAHAVRESMMERLSFEDPEYALHCVQYLSTGEFRENAFSEALWSLCHDDPGAAFAAVLRAPADLLDHDAVSDVAAAQARTDPAAVLHWLRNLPTGPAREHAIADVMPVIADADIAAALRWLAELPVGRERDRALAEAFAAYVPQAPEHALQLLEKLPPGSNLDRVMSGLVETLARCDTDLAAAFVHALPAGAAQQRAITTVLNRLQFDDAEQALAWLETLPRSPANAAAAAQIGWQLAYRDPEHALRFASRFGCEEERAALYRKAMETLAEHDRAQAEAWVQELAGPDREHAIEGLIAAQIDSDPESAMTWMLSLNHVQTQIDHAQRLGAAWTARNRSIALAAAQRLPAGPLRDAFHTGACDVIGRDDPAAATLLAASLPPGAPRDDAMNTAVRRWAEADPAAAARWLEQATPSRADDLVATVSSQWANFDPEAAAAWLQRLPTGNGREMAVQAYIERVAPTAPADAGRLVPQITNPEKRYAAIERVVRPWLGRDRAAAITWLAATDAPAELRTRLLQE